jgi:hypothetical protein
MLVQKPECRKPQRQSCSADWLLITPIPRPELLYQELLAGHSHFERIHRHWRTRYRVAPKALDSRPKWRGIAWQPRRAMAALLIDWARICCYEGWFGSAPQPEGP